MTNDRAIEAAEALVGLVTARLSGDQNLLEDAVMVVAEEMTGDPLFAIGFAGTATSLIAAFVTALASLSGMTPEEVWQGGALSLARFKENETGRPDVG